MSDRGSERGYHFAQVTQEAGAESAVLVPLGEGLTFDCFFTFFHTIFDCANIGNIYFPRKLSLQNLVKILKIFDVRSDRIFIYNF